MPGWLTPDLIISIAALLVFIGICVFASHRAGQPYNIEKPDRVPWKLVLILSGFLAAMVFVHMINLFGYETGVDKGLLGRR